MDWTNANFLIFNVNVFAFLLTWIILGSGMVAAGHYLAQAIGINKAMRDMRPANRSITTHHAIRVIRVSWKLFVLLAVLGLEFFLLTRHVLIKNPYTLLLAVAFLSAFTYLWHLFDKHIRFGHLLALSTSIPFLALGFIVMPGAIVLMFILMIIAWKIIGSQGYADGMVLRDYMIDKARYFDGRRWRRR